jgi:hypothetical protein
MTTLSKIDAWSKKPARFNLFWLLVLSFASLVGASFVLSLIQNTDPLKLFISNFLFVLPILFIMWLFLGLPWCLVMKFIGRVTKRGRLGETLVLAPAVLLFFNGLVSASPDSSAWRTRFNEISGVELPANVEGLRVQHEFGGCANGSTTYYFRTTPDEMDRLISELQFYNANDRSVIYGGVDMPELVLKLRNCPSSDSWDGRQLWLGGKHLKLALWAEMIVDADKTQAYIKFYR